MTDELVVNPNFWLESRNIDRGIIRSTIFSPVKGRGLLSYYVDMRDGPEMFRLVTEIDKARVAGSAMPHVSDEQRQSLYQMGILVQKEEISRPVYFHCFLNDETLDWIPLRCRQTLAFDGSSPLIVNPSFAYQSDERSPVAFENRIQIYDRFLPGFPLVWIENPGTRLLTAYWVDKKESEILSLFKPGAEPPASLNARFRKLLEMARILVPPDYPERCRSEWENFIADCRAQFQSRSFATFTDLLPPFYLGALRRYYRDVVAEGYAQKNDPNLALRHMRHHEDLACFLHHQLSYLLSRIAGRPLKPTHDYLYAYEEGAVLPRHIDIDEEEYAVSLLLDYEPDPGGVSPWPLYLELPPDGDVSFSQELGNAIFYNGCTIKHFRHALPPGNRSTSLVFHYVPQKFRGI